MNYIERLLLKDRKEQLRRMRSALSGISELSIELASGMSDFRTSNGLLNENFAEAGAEQVYFPGEKFMNLKRAVDEFVSGAWTESGSPANKHVCGKLRQEIDDMIYRIERELDEDPRA